MRSCHGWSIYVYTSPCLQEKEQVERQGKVKTEEEMKGKKRKSKLLASDSNKCKVYFCSYKANHATLWQSVSQLSQVEMSPELRSSHASFGFLLKSHINFLRERFLEVLTSAILQQSWIVYRRQVIDIDEGSSSCITRGNLFWSWILHKFSKPGPLICNACESWACKSLTEKCSSSCLSASSATQCLRSLACVIWWDEEGLKMFKTNRIGGSACDICRRRSPQPIQAKLKDMVIIAVTHHSRLSCLIRQLPQLDQKRPHCAWYMHLLVTVYLYDQV